MASSPARLDPQTVRALRADLANYRTKQIAARLGPVAERALTRNDPLPARFQLDGADDQLALQIRLLLLADCLTEAEVAAALPTLGVKAAVQSGLVEHTSAHHLRACLRIEDHHEVLIAADWLGAIGTGTRQLHGEHVLGVGGASRTLHSLLPPVAGKHVFDLGTGCGIQALALAAAGASQVVASDISQRALAFAELNCALNPANVPISLRRGSLFAPVAGETFDLVVSNPPFVIIPPGAYEAGLPRFEYRDAGEDACGDHLITQLLADLPEHLNPDGQAVMLANWELDATGELRTLTCPEELDLWLVQREVQDPAQYAAMWLRDAGITEGSELWDGVYRAYLNDFAHREVAAIGFGYLFAAKREAGDLPLRERTDATSAQALTAARAWAIFAMRRWLHGASDEQVAASRLVARSELTIDHHFAAGDNQPRTLTISNPAGLLAHRSCDQVVAGLISASDGQLSVGQIAGALAALLEVDHGQMMRACTAAARQLLANGDADLATDESVAT